MVGPLFGVSRLPYAHGMTLPFSEVRTLADTARSRWLMPCRARMLASCAAVEEVSVVL